MRKALSTLIAGLLFIAFFPSVKTMAKDEPVPTCDAMDRLCLAQQVQGLTPLVKRREDRDHSYRELARTYAFEGRGEDSLTTLLKIEDQEMRARGIAEAAMAAAVEKGDTFGQKTFFTKLSDQARAISSSSAQGAAFIGIVSAMAQAGDDAGGRLVCAAMANAALRNTAYSEMARVEASRGDVNQVTQTLNAIDVLKVKDSSYDAASRIFLEKALIRESHMMAVKIADPLLKSRAIQRILDKGNEDSIAAMPKTVAP